VKQRSGKVLTYVRVSTEEQSLSGLDLADQRAAIERTASVRGWLDVEFVSNAGFSAKT
jgi:DNA invertase Pin-like site-specific DNA recombinase